MNIPNLDKDPTGKTFMLQHGLKEFGYYSGAVDNWPGPLTDAALKEFQTGLANKVTQAEASSFADPADLRAFIKCKGTGKTDLQCFAVGDNGIGATALGSLKTSQLETPMCALTRKTIIDRWGSIAGGKGKMVVIKVSGAPAFDCLLGDILGVEGRIDLNPAAAKLANQQPPFTVQATWGWKDDLTPAAAPVS